MPSGTPPTASPARWRVRARRWTSWASGRQGRSPTRPASTRSPICRGASAGLRSRPSTGGAGAATDAFGGADGFAVGKDAPPEAVDFLAFITNEANQETWAANSGLPVNPAAVDAVTDPNMQAVLEGLNAATFIQLFLDQFFTAEVGAQINDQTALLFAGETTPEEAAAAITATAGG